MHTGKNDYVTYTYDTENLSSYVLRSYSIRPQKPIVEFHKDGKNNRYFIRIFAIIPSEIKNVFIGPPEGKHKVKTHLGTFETRIISVQWKEDIPPNEASTFNLWSIILDYSLLNPETEDDTAINVLFKYDTANDNGDVIGPRLSRGTVTTTGTPPSSGGDTK